MGWTVPMTFEAWLTTTSFVSGPEPFGELVGVDEAGPVEGNMVHLDAGLGEVIEGAENGVVLQGRGHGMVAGLEHSEQGEVQGVGRVVGEAEPVGVPAVEELRQQLPSAVDQVPGLQAEVIAGAPGVDPEVPVEMVHEHVDLFGFGEGRRAVVHEDELGHGFASASGVSILMKRPFENQMGTRAGPWINGEKGANMRDFERGSG